jgi:hypothetical protein
VRARFGGHSPAARLGHVPEHQAQSAPSFAAASPMRGRRS